MAPDDDRPDRNEDLSESESERAEDRIRPSASILHEAIRRDGEEEIGRTPSDLAFSGLAAGLSMGASMLAIGLLEAHLPDADWTVLVSSLGYTVGFLIVILGRQQLFTENTLTAVIPLLHNRDAKTLTSMLRLWVIVLASNLVGCLIFAWGAGADSVFNPEIRRAFVELGSSELERSFGSVFQGAVFAGWLIALTVWVLPGAKEFAGWIIIILTYLIGVGHFPHVIAGSVSTMHAVLAGSGTWPQYLVGFLLPTLLGNVVGGVTFVALINHGQAADKFARDQ